MSCIFLISLYLFSSMTIVFATLLFLFSLLESPTASTGQLVLSEVESLCSRLGDDYSAVFAFVQRLAHSTNVGIRFLAADLARTVIQCLSVSADRLETSSATASSSRLSAEDIVMSDDIVEEFTKAIRLSPLSAGPSLASSAFYAPIQASPTAPQPHANSTPAPSPGPASAPAPAPSTPTTTGLSARQQNALARKMKLQGATPTAAAPSSSTTATSSSSDTFTSTSTSSPVAAVGGKGTPSFPAAPALYTGQYCDWNPSLSAFLGKVFDMLMHANWEVCNRFAMRD